MDCVGSGLDDFEHRVESARQRLGRCGLEQAASDSGAAVVSAHEQAADRSQLVRVQAGGCFPIGVPRGERVQHDVPHDDFISRCDPSADRSARREPARRVVGPVDGVAVGHADALEKAHASSEIVVLAPSHNVDHRAIYSPIFLQTHFFVTGSARPTNSNLLGSPQHV